eukprot:TRINITY_DN71630_c0_g1_i1.p1 TRINITY_DN71630_c0_g1~~TRINITY_DN71630_c0_g1_i1.p1  ORF type:complete len:369 (-),score=95.11 TRINITY_DN71630_c0_g1_i1:132-1238(-)
MAQKKLRLGIMGAARNVPFSVIHPLRNNPDLAARLEVVGLASLELSEAEKCATEWGVPKAYTFDGMLADESIDAVYNVLPNHLRCQFTVKALLAKKHVLSETPFCSNAREAVVLQRAAEDSGRVLLEGSHPTCHPVTKRVREMIVGGQVGRLEEIHLQLPVGHSLQGRAICSKTGALMGVGCHGIAIVRALAGEEPVVVSAKAQRSAQSADVDVSMACELKFPSGAIARIESSVDPNSADTPSTFKVAGAGGCIHVKEWFTSGRSTNEIVLERYDESGVRMKETVDNPHPEAQTTFYYQLMAFVDEVQGQQSRGSVGMPWDYQSSEGPSSAMRNMATIDACYSAAGMKPRGSLAAPPQPYDHIGASKL